MGCSPQNQALSSEPDDFIVQLACLSERINMASPVSEKQTPILL